MTPTVTSQGFAFDPIVPMPVVALLGLGLLAFTLALHRGNGAGPGRGRNLVLLLLRLSGLALVLLLLLQPSRLELIRPPVVERIVLVGVDTSRSMKQADADRATRLDAARQLLIEAGVVGRDGRVTDGRVRLFQFSDSATNVTGSVSDLKPQGTTTRLHQPVTEMLASVGVGETAVALILLTDGHDFQLVIGICFLTLRGEICRMVDGR